ncbi:hypothetical protein M900_0768 [Bacteriovorax sp. Seq25_V]|nr:hypothetical protein M900_0768 [Bacteriovorax sp. Seq25_V]
MYVGLLGLCMLSTAYVTNELSSTAMPSRTIASVKEEMLKNGPIKLMLDDTTEFQINISDSSQDLAATVKEVDVSLEEIKKQKEELEKVVKEKELEISKLNEEIELNKKDTAVALEKSEELAKALEEKSEEVGKLRESIAKLQEVEAKAEEFKNQISSLLEENEALKAENSKLACMVQKQESLEEKIRILTEDKQKIADTLKKLIDDTDGDKDKDDEDDDKRPKKKVADDKDKAKAKENLQDADYMELYASFYQMIIQQRQDQEMQQQLQQQQFQMMIIAQMKQRSVVNDLYGMPNVSGQFYNNAANQEISMLATIQSMRMNENNRQQDYMNKAFRPESYFGLNTGTQLSFADQYIQRQSMMYSPQNSIVPQNYNMNNSGYNFELNSTTKSMFDNSLASYSPMAPSSIAIFN